jgi:hypothetical protein
MELMENSESNRANNLMVYAVCLLLCLGSYGSIPCGCQGFIFSKDGPVDLWGPSSLPFIFSPMWN